MNEKDVVELLKQVESIGINVWITGGWGVDAILGRQTRPHSDIDFFVQKKDASAFIEMIKSNGYCRTKVESDDQSVWCAAHDRAIDLHLFEFAEEGTLRFENEIYPSDILNGKGTIGVVTVRCLTAEAQVIYHQGYDQKEKDRHDVLLLCSTFGFLIPEEYAREKQNNINVQ